MKPQRVSTLLILFLALATLRSSDVQAQTDNDNKLMIADFKTLPLVVEPIPSNNANLSKESVQTRAELRMRSSGLKPVTTKDSPFPFRFLYVRVYFVGAAFHITVSFQRSASWVITPGKDGSGAAETWHTEILGTHLNASAYILASLDERMDEFLNAYLKVNQDSK